MLSRIILLTIRRYLAGLLVILSSILFSQTANAELHLTAEEKSWIAAHPVIRIGIDASYAPYSFQKDGSSYNGIVPDFLTYIEENTGLDFQVSPDLTWPEIMQDAKNKDLDVIATAFKTPEREEFFDFSQNYINTPLIIMKLAANDEIHTASDIIGKKIALVKGYRSTDRVLSDYPDIIPNYVTTPLEGLQAVAIGKADAYIGVLGVSIYVARENGLTNLVVGGQYDLSPIGQGFATRKDWPELTRILGKVLDSMSMSDRNKIINNWIPILTSKTRNSRAPTDFQLSREDEQWLRQHQTIRIGVMNAWPPMDYMDHEGNNQGIGVDFIRLFNKRLNGLLKIYPDEWPVNYQKLQDGKLDALMDITPSAARQEIFSFTTPYLDVPHVIFGQKNSPPIDSVDDLKGKTVALEEGFFLANRFEKEFPDINVTTFATTSDALDAVSKGQAYAYVGNRAVAMYIIRNELIENVTEYGKISGSSSVNAIAVKKDNIILQRILQNLLDSVSLNERRAITKDWVADPQRQLLLTRQEREWLKSNPVIKVAADIDFPPVEFVGSDGKFQGLAVDYLNRVSDMLGVKFEADTKSAWSRNVEKLENGELDMFSAAGSTSERKKFATFTAPYMQLPLVIFALNTVPYIDGIAGLKNKKVAVVKNYAVGDYMKAGNLGLDIIEVPTIEDGLQQLNDKKVDAYIGTILVTGHAIREKGFTNIRVAGETPFKNAISMAVRSDMPIFHSILQKTLDSISEEDKGRIMRNWVGLQTTTKADYTLFWQIAAGSFVLLLLFIAWNAYLQRRVKLQGSESKLLQEQLRQAQKMDAVGQLTGGIAHDFNNILAIVLGNLELLEEVKENDLASMKKIRTAISGAKRGADLTRKLLNFSRENTEGTQVIDVNIFIAELKDFIEKSLTVSIDIKFDFAPILWTVKVDTGDLQDILINLAINARDAMPNGGTLVFKTRNRVLNADYVRRHPQGKTGNFIEISISDTGIGMSSDVMERIFEPFFTTKKVGEGTGLGLSMVYGFVKRSGGHITINSEQEKGTSINIYLPRAKRNAQKKALQKQNGKKALPGGKETILIVDDEKQLLEIAKNNLEALGYRTFTAKNSSEAVDLLKKNDAIDLLFSDVVIPGGTDGFKLATQAMKLKKNLRVLLTSGYAKKREELITGNVELDKALATNLLRKPYSKSELANAVRQTFDNEM